MVSSWNMKDYLTHRYFVLYFLPHLGCLEIASLSASHGDGQ
jgi:hypothetical protein